MKAKKKVTLHTPKGTVRVSRGTAVRAAGESERRIRLGGRRRQGK